MLHSVTFSALLSLTSSTLMVCFSHRATCYILSLTSSNLLHSVSHIQPLPTFCLPHPATCYILSLTSSTLLLSLTSIHMLHSVTFSALLSLTSSNLIVCFSHRATCYILSLTSSNLLHSVSHIQPPVTFCLPHPATCCILSPTSSHLLRSVSHIQPPATSCPTSSHPLHYACQRQTLLPNTAFLVWKIVFTHNIVTCFKKCYFVRSVPQFVYYIMLWRADFGENSTSCR
jgi:hypothetical protein